MEGEGQRSIAACTAQRAGGVGGIDSIADTADIAAGQGIVVEPHRRIDADHREGIAAGDGQRRGGAVAIAIGQGVGEHVAGPARRVRIAGVAVAAVGREGEDTVLAGDQEVGAGVGVEVGRNVEAGHRQHPGATVGPYCIAATVALGIGDDVAGRRTRGDGVGIVRGNRPVVREREVGADVGRR